MKKKVMAIMITLTLSYILIGCNYNETIILENSKLDRIIKPLIEFKINKYSDYDGKQSKIMEVGYHRGNIYVARYDYKYWDASEKTFEESLYVLNSDGSLKKSELNIPVEYSSKYGDSTFKELLFSETKMFNWKSGIEKTIITPEMLNEITIDKNINHKLNKTLDLVIGSNSYVSLVCKSNTEAQIIIVDLDTGNYKVTKPIKNDDDNINVIYDKYTSQFYLVISDGTILRLDEENGILEGISYNKIDLDNNYKINKVTSSNGNIYFEVGLGKENLSSRQSIFYIYDIKDKKRIEIHRDTPEKKLRFIESDNGYVTVASKISLNNQIDLYKYHLARLEGDEIKYIRTIAEDETHLSLDPKVYVNESEKIVLVSSTVNKGVIVKYQVFELK